MTECRGSYLHQVLPGEQRQADVFHQVSQVFLADVFVVVDPGDHRLEDLQAQTHSDDARGCGLDTPT